MPRLLVAALLVAALCVENRAFACAACGCGDQTLTAFGVEKPYQNRIRIALEERYTELKFGSDTVGDVNQTLRSALAVSWTPFRRVTFAAMLPWMSLWITPLRGTPTQTVNDLGDLEVSSRVLIWSDRHFMARHLIWGLAGIKTPTGPRATDERGIPIDSDLQPASGSWDPIFGATYGYFGGLVSVFASASYRVTTRGYAGYRFGSQLGASAAAQLQRWWWSAAQAGFDLRWSQPDELPNGHASPDTGGTVVYFTPALLFTPTPSGNIFIRAAVSIPFLQRLEGLQLYGTQATLSVAFDVN